MITEDYCSFEVAKLLKEKGFNEPVTELNKLLFKEGEKPVLKITHQKAMKWLREQDIECVVIPIWNTLGKQYRSYVLSDLGDRYKDNYDSYSDNMSYEEAVEAAIKYCLENLI